MADAYDPDNVFAKILRGEIPCFKIYEDAKTFAFMDIMPRADGHTLVIPKAPARNLFDIAEDDLAAVARTLKTVAIAAREAMGADGVYVVQANEREGGQEVFHLHFHVIPRRAGMQMRPPASVKEDMAVLKANAAKIVAALQG